MPDPLHPYGARASATITTRLTTAQREQVLLAAAAHGKTVGEFARSAIVRLTGTPDPGGVADDLRAALGLDPTATPEEILAAVSELCDELLALDEQPPAGSAPIDPLAGAPDMPPPAQLNKGQLAALAKVGLPLTPEGWRVLTGAPSPAVAAEVAKLSKDVLKQIKAKGMTPTQFVVLRNAATHRST